jgi:hypothetical protein
MFGPDVLDSDGRKSMHPFLHQAGMFPRQLLLLPQAESPVTQPEEFESKARDTHETLGL